MDETSVKATCNWSLCGGCEFSKAIQTKISHEGIFIKPELDDILTADRAILLKSPLQAEDNVVPACELQLGIFPRYKIESLTFVCSASKVELSLGPQNEYAETVYGTTIADDDEEEQPQKVDGDEMAPPSLFYRYDIEVQKSGIVQLMLKLLPITPEICIYGILLQLAPNPNGVTTLLPTAINLDNVQHMLSSSPNAEKCKMLMQMIGQSASQKMAAASQAKSDACLSPTLDTLKIHIDRRMAELEVRLNARLDAFNGQQTAKLDQILTMLHQSLNKKN